MTELEMKDKEHTKAMEICLNDDLSCEDCPLKQHINCEDFNREYFYTRFKELASENALLHERRSKAELRAERAEQMLADCIELVSNGEAGRAAAKIVFDEVYREVERVRMECEFETEGRTYLMDVGDFVGEFTLGVLPRLYKKYGFDIFQEGMAEGKERNGGRERNENRRVYQRHVA